MYYRYKSKKKDRKFLKLLLMLLITVSAVYAVYNFRSKIQFWRVSHNTIIDKIHQAAAVTDPNERIEKLRRLTVDLGAYKKDNPNDPDSYIYSSRVNYYLGLALSGKNFTEMYVDDRLMNLSSEQRGIFSRSIKDMSKAMAFLDGKEMDVHDLFILGKCYFFTGYKDNRAVYSMLKNAVSNIDMLVTDDIRFYSLLCLSEGAVEEGIAILDSKGAVEETVYGRLFKAKALKNSSRNTEAIIAFQKILKTAEDPYVQKLSYSNLGKIYFSQNLYRESLEQFNAALLLGDDKDCKIWTGKNYLAMGMKDKAKAVWAEVLNSDSDNEEVKKLLGSL